MKIAIVVHGRFHGFDLAKALIRRGHDVTLLTNYPKWAVKRFGIAPEHVRSCWPHGVASRLLGKAPSRTYVDFEKLLHPWFETWAASEVAKSSWDVVHCWSGVAESILRQVRPTGSVALMMRGSAHIRLQAEILADEERRTGVKIDSPKPWIIAREEREYALADRIVVLSSFAYRSFVQCGVDPSRLLLVPLGANTQAFRAGSGAVEARYKRILSGQPLRVLCTGLVSFRKGLWDLAAVVRGVQDGRFQFRCVGSVLPEARDVVEELRNKIEFVSKQPQNDLPRIYEDSDVFLFPTLEDGFAAVLAQANANGLPIITTTNCGGPDFIEEGKTGWIVPIRSPEAILERLNWCDTHRNQLAEMARYTASQCIKRDWNDVATDFERGCQKVLEAKREALQKHDRATA